MRTVHANYTAETTKTITKPGYLVQLSFAIPLYFSSRGTHNYLSQTWVDMGFDYQDGRLIIPDVSGALTAVIKAEGVSDLPVTITQFYGDAPVATASEIIFSGFADGAPALGPRVEITLYQESDAGLYAPRLIVTQAVGFHVLPAPGYVLFWNEKKIVLPGERGS